MFVFRRTPPPLDVKDHDSAGILINLEEGYDCGSDGYTLLWVLLILVS